MSLRSIDVFKVSIFSVVFLCFAELWTVHKIVESLRDKSLPISLFSNINSATDYLEDIIVYNEVTLLLAENNSEKNVSTSEGFDKK